MKQVIYLDNAATTPIDKDVLKAMMPFLTDEYYNPSAPYDYAYDLSVKINECKNIIAETLNCNPNEIYFTSCGSESDNWALRYVRPGGHIITSKIEHHAILNTCKYLESIGVEVTYLDVDSHGLIPINSIEHAIKDNTKLISIMYANNEIGTIQQINDIGRIAKKYNIVFHTDAVQAYGHVDIDVNNDYIDMLSASAHKFNGPKGIGFLYIRNDVNLDPLIYGGHQQSGKRAGTYNVPGIIGMTTAAKTSCEHINSDCKYISGLRDYMWNRLSKEIDDIFINGFDVKSCGRVVNNLNVCFKNIQGEQLLTLLSMNGICVSTGSACNSNSGDVSHVFKAFGLSVDDAYSSIRFTLSKSNTKEEIDYVIDVLKRSVEQLRRINKNED